MMRNPPLKTYERKNNGKLNFSSYQKHKFNFNVVEMEEKKKKEIFDDSLQDPFDTTFDRLLKYAKEQPPPPPPDPGLSYINSSLEVSDFQSYVSPKVLISSDSEEDFKQSTPEKKPRLKKQGSKPVKSKTKTTKPSKLIKEKTAVNDGEKMKMKKTTKPNRKKTKEEKVKLPAKRKVRRISSSSEDSITNFVLVKRKIIPESSSKDDPSVHSNSNLVDFSFTETPESVKSLPDIADKNDFEEIMNAEKLISNTEHLHERSNESSHKESFHSEGSFNFKKSLCSKDDFHSSKTDSVTGSKILSRRSMKACSVVLKRCDWMLKKENVFVKLKSCAVKIPRLNIKAKRKFSAAIRQVLEKKTEDETENEKETELENEVKNGSAKETSSGKSLQRETVDKSQLSESLALKDCFVKLARVKPTLLASSTPFVKRNKDFFLLGGISPITLEINNIVSQSESSQTQPPEIESITAPMKASQPHLQLKDIDSNDNNHKSNPTPKRVEFNSEILNVSSDYSEIDWTTVSLSDSQCINAASFREQQKTRVPTNKTGIDSPVTVNSSAGQNLEPILMQFDFVTKRNLNLIPEYEKSTSMFDDTKISESQYMSGKLTPLKIDEKSLELLPTMASLTKISPLKSVFVVDSSVLNQSEFKGFESHTSPKMKKLSPMTAIPTSNVDSLSCEDTDKSFILESEKGKNIRSLALEKRLSEGKSPRKCLSFEELSPITAIHTSNVDSLSWEDTDKSFILESEKGKHIRSLTLEKRLSEGKSPRKCLSFEELSPMTAIPTSNVDSLSWEDTDKSFILESEKGKHIRSLALEKRLSEGKSPRKCLSFEELSPMTAIPTSNVDSLSCEDTDKSFILESEKDKHIRSLALEKRLSEGKSLRKCLSFEELSPMTAIPTSNVDSLSCEDTDKSFILESEKDKHIRSLALEKRFSEGKSPRKCLSFEERPKICREDDSVSLNKEESFDKLYFNEESINKESFDKEFIKESFNKESIDKEFFNKESNKESLIESFDPNSFSRNSSQDFISQDSPNNSFSPESLTKESITCNYEKKFGSKLGLDDLISDSSCKLEISQSSVRNQSVMLKDEKCEMTEKTEKTVEEKFEEIPEDKEGEILESEGVNTSEFKFRQSMIPLNRLGDPIRITHQRKKYKNWGMQLTAITENESRRSSVEKGEISPLVEEVKIDSILDDTVCLTSNASLNNGKDEKVPEQYLFLKPGKSWARSLSILNNIHSRDDVDRLCVGKGKKWRNSVITILDMQNKGILQSCVKQQDGLNTPQKCGGALNGNSEYESRVERLSTFGCISPSRFVKPRISIRVVPDVNKLDGVEDTQFLEAYGISSSQRTKTLSQRFSSLEDNLTIAEHQEIYNVQLEESFIKTIDTPPLVTARDVVLERCRQDDYLSFDECYPEKFLQHCRKIGEGVYGEVFLHDNGTDNSVIKIIPIEGDVNVNGEPQKKFHEILSEIVIAKELHDLRFGEKNNTAGFVEVKSIKCIIGRYPSRLVELWKAYDDEKKSENDCPSMFDENQLYISLELGHGGQDLEAFVFQNASESCAVFIQTAFALAVAEQSLEFEHRDLHWGNILISRSRKSQVTYKIDDKEISFPSTGVKVAIIDFTLSRMSYQNCCIFNDLALDPALFTAEGEYQFEIYRLMRDRIQNQWQTFEPFTNVLWLHYVVDKMIKLVRYKKKTTKVHKAAIEKLKELKDQILNYDSAFDLVTNCDKFTSLYDMNTSGLSPF